MEEIVKNEFLFYAKLAKPLVLNLPKSKDRILSAAWIKKFQNEKVGDEQLRTTYLKLLLFCLQRRKLTGIFADDPSNYEILEELPADIDLNEFARNLIEQERAERREMIRLEMMGDMDHFPAFTTDCSSDLTEYVAAQDIPNFGVHAFYAISKQPVNKWQRADFAIFPKGIKSAIDTSATATSELVPSCVCAPKGTSSAPEVEESGTEGNEPDCRKKKEDKSPERKKRRPKKLGTSPPSHPIGEVRHSTDDRITPTWGTNLMEVKERTDIGQIEQPSEANKALDEKVAKMIEEAKEEEEERERAEGPPMETTASKAKDMLQVIEEFKHGKMDKSKKPPKRLAKLGDKSRITAPKSIKEPKIAVKGMKKSKGKGGLGPKPANLPEEFADWTEKDLEEGGLTWADLMPIEENIDDELQQFEDDAMGNIDDGEIEGAQFDIEGYQEIDYDALIREAEAELDAEKTVYDQGLEEDEVIVEQFDDEIENLEDELDVSRDAAEARRTSPALSRGIPVTTPHRSASPKRVKSPEKVFAEENDNLLAHRQSPLRPPRIPRWEPRKKKKPSKPSKPTDKDPHIAKVYKKVEKIVHQDEADQGLDEMDEFEQLERQFAAQSGEVPQREHPGFSPGAADRVRQRAQQQEQMLQSPRDQSYADLDDYEMLESQFEREAGECPARAASHAFSPGDADGVRTRARQQEEALRTPDADYEQFMQQFAGQNENLDEMSPCFLSGTPPPLSEQEEFERMLKRMSPGTKDQERFLLQYGGVNANLDAIEAPPELFQTPPALTEDEEFEMYENMLQSPCPGPQERFDANYDMGYPSSDEEGSFGLLPQELIEQQPLDYIERPGDTQRYKALPRMTSEGEHIYRGVMIRKAAQQQEQLLRQGSPQAQEIIEVAERSFEDDIFKRVDSNYDQIEGSPPPGIRTPLSAFASPVSDQEFSSKRESRALRQESPQQRQSPPRQQSPPRPAERPMTETSSGPCPATKRSPSPRAHTPIATPPPSFIPGVSSPVTPQLQRPLRRPKWYNTPPPPPMFGPEERPEWYKTPVPVQHGPRERPQFYETPRDIFTCSLQGTPLDDVEMPSFESLAPESEYEALEDISSPDFDMLPLTPEEPHRTPARRRPRRPEPVGTTPQLKPGRKHRHVMKPRKLFEDEEEPCEPCGPPITLPQPCDVCDSEEPESSRRKRSHSKRRHHKHRRSSPDDMAEFEALEREAQGDEEAPCAAPPLPKFPSSPGEAHRVRERAQRQYERLMQDSPEQPQVVGVPCASGMPTGLSQPPEKIRRNKLKGKYPATPPPAAPQPSPVWSTPEGMSGPSRRRTGFSPELWNSDFQSPPPSPPRQQKFAPPKLLIKRGKVPPSPRTPHDERVAPGPCSAGPAQRVPCGGGMDTPMREDPRIRPRRLFDERGKTPRMPSAVESPIVQSPWVTPHGRMEDFQYEGPSLIEDELPPENMSPDNRPPILQEGQLYFPREDLLTGTPEGLPTMAELRRHRFTPDREHVKISHRTAFGRGPDRAPVRESCRAVEKMEQIPEFESDDAYRQHLLFEQDLETYDKYYQKPPSAYPPSQKSKHGHAPVASYRSPRPKSRSPQLPTYADDFKEHLTANTQVSPGQFPPARHSICPRKPIAHPTFERQDDTSRYDRLAQAVEEGNLQEHFDDREFEDIAWQFDTVFDYEGGLMDISPPADLGHEQNYYPDIATGADSLLNAIKSYDLPSRAAPCGSGRSIHGAPGPSQRGRTIPRAPASYGGGKSIPVASGSRIGAGSIPRAPSGLPRSRIPGGLIPRAPTSFGVGRRIPAPSGTCGIGRGGPCGAAPGAAESRLSSAPRQIPTRKSAPHKPLRETKSSQLRKEKFARDQAEKEAQLKKAQQAQKKKEKAQDKKRAAIQAKRAADREAAVCPGAALIKDLQEHEIYFPGYGKKKEMKRSFRSQFAGFQEHPLEEDEMETSCQGRTARSRRAADDRDIRYPEIGEMEGQHIDGNINYPAIGLIEEDNEVGPVDLYEDDYDYQETFQGSDDDIFATNDGQAAFRSSRIPTDAHEAEELEEFEELERLARNEQPICPARRGRRRHISEEEELNEFEELERLTAENQVYPGGVEPRYPTTGVTYSPPRPQSRFGPGPYEHPGRHLPSGLPSRTSSCPWAAEAEHDPDDAFLLDNVLPPIFDDMDEEDRLPSPALRPKLVRREVESMARTRYDPAYRGDAIPKAQRRVARSPCAGIGEIQEEEPLLPCFAEGGSFREQRDERKRQRRHPEEKRSKKKKHRSQIEQLQASFKRKTHEVLGLPPVQASPEIDEAYGVLDESLPEDLLSPRIRPQRPCSQHTPRGPAAPVALELAFARPVYSEYYSAPADLPIHPDLVDLANYDFGSPFGNFAVVGIEDEQAPEDLFFTPQRYPELEELDCQSFSPVGTCGSYSPESMPFDDLLNDELLENADRSFLTTPPGGGGPDQQTFEEFLAGSPRQHHQADDVQFKRYLQTADKESASQPSSPSSPSQKSRGRRSPGQKITAPTGPCGTCGSPPSEQAETLGPDRRTVEEFLRDAINENKENSAQFRRYLPTVGDQSGSQPPPPSPPSHRSRRSPSPVQQTFGSADPDRETAEEFFAGSPRHHHQSAGVQFRRYLPTVGGQTGSQPSSPSPPPPRSRRTPSPVQHAGPCGTCETPSPQKFQRLAQEGEMLDDYGPFEEYQTPEQLSSRERARGTYETPSPQRFARLADHRDMLDDYGPFEDYQTPEQLSSRERARGTYETPSPQRFARLADHRDMLDDYGPFEDYQTPEHLSPGERARGTYETPSPQRFARLADHRDMLDDYGLCEDYQTPEHLSSGERARGTYETPSPQRFERLAEGGEMLEDYGGVEEYQTPEQLSSGENYRHFSQFDMDQHGIDDMSRPDAYFDMNEYPLSLSSRVCPALSASPRTPSIARAAPPAEQPGPPTPTQTPPRGCRGAQQARPLEEFIRGPERRPGPETGAVPKQYSVEEAQKRASKRLREKKCGVGQKEFSSDKKDTQFERRPCSAVTSRLNDPDGTGGGQPAELVSLEEYLRAGPVPGAGPQKQQQQQEPPRKQVRKTTSVTKTVTRRNR